MKYAKGTFTVVPNRELLRGLPPTTQALYVWLCSYADENGECYPSRSKLAKDIGGGVRTVDTHLKKLEELGLIEKENRVKNNEKQSNLYQLLIVESSAKIAPPSADIAPPRAISTPPSADIAHRTITTELQPTQLNTLEAPQSSVVVMAGEYKNVRLSRDDYNDLTAQIGREALDDLIEQLSRYIEQKGKDPYKGKTHRPTIQNWARRRKDELAAKYKTFSVIG